MTNAPITEKSLKAFWKKHIEKQCLYRIVAEKYVPDIRRRGFIPSKNPFEKQKRDIRLFCGILLNLHKKGVIMIRWWGKPVDQKIVIKTTLQDLNFHYAILDATHNPFIINLGRSIEELFFASILRSISNIEGLNRGIEGHRNILIAIRSGDQEKIGTVVMESLKNWETGLRQKPPA